MKRILFLLLMTTWLHAGLIDDLEKAILKSDLSAVEKLLQHDISISGDEKTALINLATEIIKKRENKIFINNSRTNSFFNNELNPDISYNDPIYWEKYLKNDEAFTACKTRGRIFVLTALISCLMTIVIPFALILTALSLTVMIYYYLKCKNLRKKIILKYASQLNNSYNNAIQIRQFLYKIEPVK